MAAAASAAVIANATFVPTAANSAAPLGSSTPTLHVMSKSAPKTQFAAEMAPASRTAPNPSKIRICTDANGTRALLHRADGGAALVVEIVLGYEQVVKPTAADVEIVAGSESVDGQKVVAEASKPKSFLDAVQRRSENVITGSSTLPTSASAMDVKSSSPVLLLRLVTKQRRGEAHTPTAAVVVPSSAVGLAVAAAASAPREHAGIPFALPADGSLVAITPSAVASIAFDGSRLRVTQPKARRPASTAGATPTAGGDGSLLSMEEVVFTSASMPPASAPSAVDADASNLAWRAHAQGCAIAFQTHWQLVAAKQARAKARRAEREAAAAATGGAGSGSLEVLYTTKAALAAAAAAPSTAVALGTPSAGTSTTVPPVQLRRGRSSSTSTCTSAPDSHKETHQQQQQLQVETSPDAACDAGSAMPSPSGLANATSGAAGGACYAAGPGSVVTTGNRQQSGVLRSTSKQDRAGLSRREYRRALMEDRIHDLPVAMQEKIRIRNEERDRARQTLIAASLGVAVAVDGTSGEDGRAMISDGAIALHSIGDAASSAVAPTGQPPAAADDSTGRGEAAGQPPAASPAAANALVPTASSSSSSRRPSASAPVQVPVQQRPQYDRDAAPAAAAAPAVTSAPPSVAVLPQQQPSRDRPQRVAQASRPPVGYPGGNGYGDYPGQQQQEHHHHHQQQYTPPQPPATGAAPRSTGQQLHQQSSSSFRHGYSNSGAGSGYQQQHHYYEQQPPYDHRGVRQQHHQAGQHSYAHPAPLPPHDGRFAHQQQQQKQQQQQQAQPQARQQPRRQHQQVYHAEPEVVVGRREQPVSAGAGGATAAAASSSSLSASVAPAPASSAAAPSAVAYDVAGPAVSPSPNQSPSSSTPHLITMPLHQYAAMQQMHQLQQAQLQQHQQLAMMQQMGMGGVMMPLQVQLPMTMPVTVPLGMMYQQPSMAAMSIPSASSAAVVGSGAGGDASAASAWMMQLQMNAMIQQQQRQQQVQMYYTTDASGNITYAAAEGSSSGQQQ